MMQLKVIQRFGMFSLQVQLKIFYTKAELINTFTSLNYNCSKIGRHARQHDTWMHACMHSMQLFIEKMAKILPFFLS
jgi:hypothetical protein